MMKWLKYIPFIAVALFAANCKKAFVPDVVNTPSNYLVVEGVINTGNDSTQIVLSRTVKLSDTTKSLPEVKANVFVEDDKNNRFAFREVKPGVYKSAPLNFVNVKQCKLHIVTANAKEYVSDIIETAVTPAIDSLNFTVLPTGIQFYVSTHDATNATKYYRYDFDETWEYVSFYQTNLKYENDQIKFRTSYDSIYRCWNTDHSYQILLTNASDLSKSVVNNQPLLYVDRASGKLAKGYSMLVNQYALSKEAFEYYQKLKKNTEQIGSIFDAQPTELRGNIHSLTNSNEPVLGYVTASTVTNKRVLFDPYLLNINQFNNDYYPKPYRDQCDTQVLSIEPLASFAARAHLILASGDSLLYEVVERKSDGKIIGYSYALNSCVDCRLKFKTGVNNRPPYWPPYL